MEKDEEEMEVVRIYTRILRNAGEVAQGTNRTLQCRETAAQETKPALMASQP